MKIYTLTLDLPETTAWKYYSVYWPSESWWPASHQLIETALRSELNWIRNIQLRIST